jgi:hypothetical protein
LPNSGIQILDGRAGLLAAPKTPARIILKRPPFILAPPCRPTTGEILKKTETDRAEIFLAKKIRKTECRYLSM